MLDTYYLSSLHDIRIDNKAHTKTNTAYSSTTEFVRNRIVLNRRPQLAVITGNVNQCRPVLVNEEPLGNGSMITSARNL